MSAAKPVRQRRRRRNPSRIETRIVVPKCFVCGDPAEYLCNWITCHYVDYPGTVDMCLRAVCYLHAREVDENQHYCVNHWDQLAPGNMPQVVAR